MRAWKKSGNVYQWWGLQNYRTVSPVNGLCPSLLWHSMLFSSHNHSTPSLQPKTAADLHSSCLQPCWHPGGSQEGTLEVYSQNCFLAEQASFISRVALSQYLVELRIYSEMGPQKYTVSNSQVGTEGTNLIEEMICKTKSFWIHHNRNTPLQ